MGHKNSVDAARPRFPRRRRAKQELLQRESLVRLSGARVGNAPRIYMLREALDSYCDALASVGTEGLVSWLRAGSERGQLLCRGAEPSLHYYLSVGLSAALQRKPVVRARTPGENQLEVFEMLEAAEAALQICFAVRRVEAFLRVLMQVEGAAKELRDQ